MQLLIVIFRLFCKLIAIESAYRLFHLAAIQSFSKSIIGHDQYQFFPELKQFRHFYTHWYIMNTNINRMHELFIESCDQRNQSTYSGQCLNGLWLVSHYLPLFESAIERLHSSLAGFIWPMIFWQKSASTVNSGWTELSLYIELNIFKFSEISSISFIYRKNLVDSRNWPI